MNDKANIFMGNAQLQLSGKDITEHVGALTLTGNEVAPIFRPLAG